MRKFINPSANPYPNPKAQASDARPTSNTASAQQIPSHSRPPFRDSIDYSMADRIRVVVRVRGGTASKPGNRAHTRAVSLDAGVGAGGRSSDMEAIGGSPILSSATRRNSGVCHGDHLYRCTVCCVFPICVYPIFASQCPEISVN